MQTQFTLNIVSEAIGTYQARPIIVGIAVSAVLVMSARSASAQDSLSVATIKRFVESTLPTADSVGVVIGLLAADGSQRTLSVGRTHYDANTLFEIGSVTKVFTGILLGDMIQRGEVRLDQPVDELLPDTVIVPQRGERRITLSDLATHTAGLALPRNRSPTNPANPWGSYTVDRLYAHLRAEPLSQDIGVRYEYSNVGFGLLGHALAQLQGTSYDSLLTRRVLAPLKLTSTRIDLDSVLQRRLAPGHNAAGERTANWTTPGIPAAGALRSSVADLLTFLEANVRPPNGVLGRAIRESHIPRFEIDAGWQIGLGWQIFRDYFGSTIIWHGGGTGGYRSFVGINAQNGTGVVVLTNSREDMMYLGMHLLERRFPLATQRQVNGFLLLVLGLGGSTVLSILIAWRKVGAPRPGTAITLAALAVIGWALLWMFVVPFTNVDTAGPVSLAAVVLSVALALAVGLSPVGFTLSAGLPLAALIGFQGFRLLLDSMMWQTYSRSVLPPLLTYSGYTVELVYGLLSVLLAAFLSIRPPTPHVVRVWNVVGIALLSIHAWVALANEWSALSAFVWIPSVLLPLALLDHVVVARKVNTRSAPGFNGR